MSTAKDLSAESSSGAQDAETRANSTVEQTRRPGMFVKTFGCQMNEYDTDKLFKIFESDYQRVEKPDQAELVLVNTCSVRDKPEQKLYSLLGELKELKDSNPNLRIGVGGCVAQQEGATILKRNKAVDIVFGTHNLSLVPALLRQRENTGKPQVAINYRDEWEELPLGYSGSDRVSTFISISRGCNKNCTYCIVPTTRGPEVSRSVDEILREVKIAVHRGSKEVILLGQTVNSWGLDLSPRQRFSELVSKIGEVEGLDRIRFTSPHPQDVKTDFIELMKDCPKICKHIHLPLQSGSDRVLKAMNRNYRRSRYIEIVDELRSAVPDIGLTTDVIVGFPGETPDDLEQTLEVMRYARFQNSYAFCFSPRPGTAASEMKDDVSEEDKLARLKQVIDLQEALAKVELSRWLGRTIEVLLDGPSAQSRSTLHGRSSQNISVNFEPDERLKPGMLLNAHVTQVARFSLKAQPAF